MLGKKVVRQVANERRNGSLKGRISFSAALEYLGMCSSRPRKEIMVSNRIEAASSFSSVLEILFASSKKKQLPPNLITDFAGEWNGKTDSLHTYKLVESHTLSFYGDSVVVCGSRFL